MTRIGIANQPPALDIPMTDQQQTEKPHRDEKRLSVNARLLLANLRAAPHEGTSIPGDDPNATYEHICLDNVERPNGMTERQFSGYLSALKQAGFWRPYNLGFGDVRMPDEPSHA